MRHRRLETVSHEFRYGLYLSYLDLEELPFLLEQGLLSRDRWSAAAFLREDHFGDPRAPLDQSVRDEVESQAGFRPRGPIRMLTLLRQHGYYFSPITLFYCFGSDDSPEAVVAEVTNTPWNEKCLYVLRSPARGAGDRTLKYRHRKEMHVSPFLTMDHEYAWRLRAPGAALAVHITNFRNGNRAFDASLVMKRRALHRTNLNRLLLTYPLLTWQVSAAIYFEAFRLWMKSCPYVPHPAPPAAETQPA